ncbi:MAG: hydroxymethylpyrimidine/phosphomethylpyrimidine kinase [Oxalobacter sp.]
MEAMERNTRPCVLVFAGLDPSGGAGISADIDAVGAVGAHALPVITALTVQDNDRVYAVNPVDASVIAHQAKVLMDKIPVAAIKVGIVGNRENALVIREAVVHLRRENPSLPVVLDTVLGSGHGFALTDGVPEYALSPLMGLATVVTPNLPEAKRLYPKSDDIREQAVYLMAQGAKGVLIKGGHSDEPDVVVNHWFGKDDEKHWQWHRLPGEFHGTGCTLASAIAGYLAQGVPEEEAIEKAQQWCQHVLEQAFSIAEGQLILGRHG